MDYHFFIGKKDLENEIIRIKIIRLKARAHLLNGQIHFSYYTAVKKKSQIDFLNDNIK